MNLARSGSPGMRTTFATSSLLQRMQADAVSNMGDSSRLWMSVAGWPGGRYSKSAARLWVYGGRQMPFSVTMAVIRLWSVTSNAGL